MSQQSTRDLDHALLSNDIRAQMKLLKKGFGQQIRNSGLNSLVPNSMSEQQIYSNQLSGERQLQQHWTANGPDQMPISKF